jgi:FkbH-like protein
LGLDSFVFIDDNPVERELVKSQMPLVEVPSIGDDVTRFIDSIDKPGFFETTSLSEDDFDRSARYADNLNRVNDEKKFDDYDDFLKSLEMKAEIKPFLPVYIERITQLTNKTNQFNLTTRRYNLSEIESISKDSNFVTLYGRLGDKFGDNGLVSLIIGSTKGLQLHVDLWIMSCRVLNRKMELAMFRSLLQTCREKGISEIIGFYFKTPKNGMVSDHYKTLGFQPVSEHQKTGDSVWKFAIPEDSGTDIPLPIEIAPQFFW